MVYEKIGWKNGQAPLVNDVNLNRMDEGIKSANDGVDGLIDGTIFAGNAKKINNLTSNDLIKVLGDITYEGINNVDLLDSQVCEISSEISQSIGLPQAKFYVINFCSKSEENTNSQVFISQNANPEIYLRSFIDSSWTNVSKVITSRNTPSIAQYKNGTGTFPANGSSVRIDDPFITINTSVSVSPKQTKEKYWKCESFNGYFVLSSHEGGPDGDTSIEPSIISFDWSAVKGE